jgi:chemotaxis protein CheD
MAISNEFARAINGEIQTIDIQTGEVKTGGRNAVLISTAIGSCIAVVAFDATAFVGGIAHIMLPGKAPENSEQPHTRYVHDGFSVLMTCVQSLGGKKENISVCLVGGANVIGDPHDSICRENTDAVIEQCVHYDVPIVAQSLGGYLRRRVMLNIGRRLVFCGIGDQSDFILWSFSKETTE